MKQGTQIVWANGWHARVIFTHIGHTDAFDGEVAVRDSQLVLGDCDHDYVSPAKAANLMAQLKRKGFTRVK